MTVKIVDGALSDGDNSSLVTFEFSEAVTGLTAGDLTAVNGTLSGITMVDADSYTAIFTATDGFEGTGSVSVTADSYTDAAGNLGATGSDSVTIDTKNPRVLSVTPSVMTIADARVGNGAFRLKLVFSESMDMGVNPTIAFPVENPAGTLRLNAGQSGWRNATAYVAVYNVADANVNLANIDVRVTGARDLAGNVQQQGNFANRFNIDTRNPRVQSIRSVSFNSATGILTYRVVFTEPVTGVDAGDVRVRTNGQFMGTSIRSISGRGTTYTVRVHVRFGSGTVRLDLVDDNSIRDVFGNRLGGNRLGDGNFAGQAVNITSWSS